jgi:hypothetical protein
MNVTLKKRFTTFRNEQSLRCAIESVCAEFGRVTQLKILPATRYSSLACACFLRLDSVHAEIALKSTYDVIIFGGELHFFVEVDEEWDGPIMPA